MLGYKVPKLLWVILLTLSLLTTGLAHGVSSGRAFASEGKYLKENGHIPNLETCLRDNGLLFPQDGSVHYPGKAANVVAALLDDIYRHHSEDIGIADVEANTNGDVRSITLRTRTRVGEGEQISKITKQSEYQKLLEMGVPIKHESSSHSVAQLCNTFNAVKKMTETDSQILYFEMSAKLNKVAIDVQQSPDAFMARAGLKGGQIEVKLGDRHGLELQSRLYDSSPWWGGNRLDQGCTLGFRAINNNSGTAYHLTAGHCINGGRVFTHHGQLVGRVIGDLRPNAIDVAAVGGSTYGGLIYRGSVYSSSAGTVLGLGSMFPGAYMGVSGAYGGEKRFIYRGTGCFGGVGCGYLKMEPTGNGLTVLGDSGAPWFAYTSTDAVYALGIHAGIYQGHSFASPLSTVLYLFDSRI